MLVCAGGLALLGAALFGAFKSSHVYQESFQLISASPTLQGALGVPIKAKFFVTGSLELTGLSGQADIVYDVSGPWGTGTVDVVASQSAGKWNFSMLEVKLEGKGIRIDLFEESGLGPSRSE